MENEKEVVEATTVEAPTETVEAKVEETVVAVETVEEAKSEGEKNEQGPVS